MASSFSGRVPLKETVAIERCMLQLLFLLARAFAGRRIGASAAMAINKQTHDANQAAWSIRHRL
jgi:hypothetical protein